MEVMPQGGIPSLNQGRQVKGDREFGSDQCEGVLSGGCLSKEGHPNEEQAQAENIRLLGRDVKAAVKHHIDGLLISGRPRSCEKLKFPFVLHSWEHIQMVLKKETKSFAFRLPSITPLLKLICSL